jgi:hypothetical protein
VAPWKPGAGTSSHGEQRPIDCRTADRPAGERPGGKCLVEKRPEARADFRRLYGLGGELAIETFSFVHTHDLRYSQPRRRHLAPAKTRSMPWTQGTQTRRRPIGLGGSVVSSLFPRCRRRTLCLRVIFLRLCDGNAVCRSTGVGVACVTPGTRSEIDGEGDYTRNDPG